MVSTFQRPALDEINRARMQYQRELVQDEQETAQRLLQAYSRMWRDGGPIDRALLTFVERITEVDEPRDLDIQNLNEFQIFIGTLREDMDKFSVIYQNEAAQSVVNAVSVADDAALAMTQAQLPNFVQAEILAGWNQPDPKALSELASIVDNEVWRSRQANFGINAAEDMADTILTAVAQGKHSRVIASIINAQSGVPYSWADNTVRTAQIYGYRRASHLSYASNNQFIEEWVWQAALDRRTCLSCVSQHGKAYPVSKELNDHHRGRCTPLPKVKGTTWHKDMVTGEQWFNNLSEKEHGIYRANIRNNALYDAVRDGEVPFEKLSRPYQDGVYGEMLRQTTYKEAMR